MVNRHNGFTLIELMIVIAIIGILASVVSGAIKRSSTGSEGVEIIEDDTHMIINGVPHTCDQYGVCVPDD